MPPKPRPTYHPGDIIRIKHQPGTWKIRHTSPTQGGGTRITASSLHAYPRIDITTLATRATHANQE